MAKAGAPVITNVILGFDTLAGQPTFFALEGSNLATTDTVDVASTTNANLTWSGTIVGTISNSYLARVTFTGTAIASSAKDTLDTLQITVTSGGGTSSPFQVTADVFSDD